MNEPTFDKDSYPTEETLDYIENWKLSHQEWPEFFAFVCRAWHNNGIVRMEQEDGERVIHFVTGGWSGNEAIIGALEHNRVLWAMLWKSSHRGGLHVISVPGHYDPLKP